MTHAKPMTAIDRGRRAAIAEILDAVETAHAEYVMSEGDEKRAARIEWVCSMGRLQTFCGTPPGGTDGAKIVAARWQVATEMLATRIVSAFALCNLGTYQALTSCFFGPDDVRQSLERRVRFVAAQQGYTLTFEALRARALGMIANAEQEGFRS